MERKFKGMVTRLFMCEFLQAGLLFSTLHISVIFIYFINIYNKNKDILKNINRLRRINRSTNYFINICNIFFKISSDNINLAFF